MPLPQHDPVEDDQQPFSRRAFVSLAALGGAAVGGAGLSSILASDDDDADDDDDHSGHGEDDSGQGRGRGRGGDDGDDEDVVPVEGTVPAGSAEVHIVDDDPNGFSPGTITIDAGQAVTWLNTHDDAHTATGIGFDTGIMQPGTLATVTFDEPGTFPYSCQIHPEMTGVVEVRGAAGSPEASPAAATPEAATPVTGGGDAAGVSIFNIAFDPPELTVAVGATVTWTNDDPVAHTATTDDGAFDSGVLEQGQTFEFVFDQPGTYTYLCAFHPTMTGTITVTGG